MNWKWLTVIVALLSPVIAAAAADVRVSSLTELAAAATRSGQSITMPPGVYRLIDYLPMSAVPERRKQKLWQFMTFSGSNNVFHLDGVVIEVDTALRPALRRPIHTDDFLITGSSNFLHGLTITNFGHGASPGGAALAVRGQGNTLSNCTLHVRGSFPYGYGDLFGKGGPDILAHQKKSGLLVTGDGTTLFDCRLYMHSFGHGFFIQRDASNVRLENCRVEGAMRPTAEILAETNSPAAKVNFRTVAKNRLGQNQVTPGYMKSLSEDGFRTYGQHSNLVFRNCTAKNMRGGFELRTKTAARLENCTAIGCERAFWVSSRATVSQCRGDAQYGPLLFVEGDGASVDVALLPAESSMQVHALASIQGTGHRIAIKASREGERARPVPILLGYGTPMMGEGMAPIPEQNARNVSLRNDTHMPVIISGKASGGVVTSRGPVQENHGRDVRVQKLDAP